MQEPPLWREMLPVRWNLPNLLRAAGWSLALGATTAAAPVDFAREIQPLLAGKCYDCHGPEKSKGGLQLISRAHALRGGESATPALIAGSSAKSLLIHRITTEDAEDVMPQKGERFTPAACARPWAA